MTDVREKSGSASSEDFRNAGGTPLVIDTAGKVAYAMDAAGSIFSLPANSSLTAINVSAGTTSNNLSKVTFSNANGVTFGLNASVITASVNAGGSPNFSAGTTSNNLGSVVFSDANGISFGLNGSTITASYNPPSGRSIQFSAGTKSESLSAVEFIDSNGVSFGLNNGTITATVQTNYITTAALSNHSHGNPQLNLTNLSGTTASNSAGFTLSLSAGTGLTSQSNQALSGSNGSFAFQTATFGNLNGVSFYTSNGSMVASHNGLTTARASNDAVGLNTAATNVTWTVNSSGISLNAAGYAGTGTSATNASVTLNSNGLAISVAAPGAGGGAAISAGANSQNTGTVNFANSNGVTFGLSNNGTMTAAHNGLTTARASNDGVGLNTAQTNVTWTVNSGGISVNAAGYAGTGTSATNASVTLNSNGLAISVAAPGGGAANTVSYYANARQFVNSQTMTFLQSTSHVIPFVVDENLSFGFMRIAASGSVLAASSTAATTGNTSYSAGHFRSHNVVIYSRGAGANSMSLQYLTSTQVTEAFRMTQSHALNSTQHSYTLNYTFPCSSGTTGFTKNYSSSAASLNFHTSHLTDLTGLKILEIPFAGSLSPGRYWLAYGISSTTSTARTADQSRQGIAFTALGMSQNTLAFGTLGAATNSSMQAFNAHGSFTTAGGGTTNSMPMSAVSSSASHNQLFFQLMRIT